MSEHHVGACLIGVVCGIVCAIFGASQLQTAVICAAVYIVARITKDLL